MIVFWYFHENNDDTGPHDETHIDEVSEQTWSQSVPIIDKRILNHIIIPSHEVIAVPYTTKATSNNHKFLTIMAILWVEPTTSHSQHKCYDAET